MANVLNMVDTAKAEYYCLNGERAKGLEIYKTLIEELEGVDRTTAISNFIKHAFDEALALAKEDKWIEALDLYRAVMTYPDYPLNTYKNVGLCMKAIKNYKIALTFFQLYEKDATDKYEAYINLGDIYYKGLDDMKTAITYYEKALELNPNEYSIWNMLGHLYSTYYRESHEEEQIKYLRGAYKLNPTDRVVVKNLAYVLGKFDHVEEADKLYEELKGLQPLNSDLHSYGAYLVRHGRFEEGFDYLRYRFKKEDLKNCVFPDMFFGKKGWKPGKKVNKKSVLLHSEQGFGDTIMFSRYALVLKDKCNSVTLAVQPALERLFRIANLGVNVITASEANEEDYDCIIPMMDLPLVCHTNTNNIPLAEGYLNIPQTYIDEFKKKYIGDNKKFRIGIAFEGSASSVETLRDIPLKELYPLMQLPNVQVYCFQVGELTGQIPKVPKSYSFTPLGDKFTDWLDTAAAMKSMDLMVTTDNGVMNLAGSLGVKTFGLFNSITEWRWFKTTGEDIGWYKSIKPFKCKTHNDWEPVIKQVLREVKEIVGE